MRAYYISIYGIVQGVGFRPFIYNLAIKHSLTGWIKNTTFGVQIHIEGLKNDILTFIEVLRNTPPPLSKINRIDTMEVSIENFNNFNIIQSQSCNSEYIFICPDVSTCDDCKNDILDSTNTRYLYPFTNCTNCGPRFSITTKLPYDRPFTTMKTFKQCTSCIKEYKDISNRRFHAQPNCCSTCGPYISIFNNKGLDLSNSICHSLPHNNKNYTMLLINFFKQRIYEGSIFAIKSLTGFHLCCSPFLEEAVNTLRLRKFRPKKPFAIMMKDIDTVKKFCHVSKEEEKLLLSNAKPIILLKKLNNINLPYNVAPNNKLLGVMLPSTPLHILLFEKTDIKALIMTSGNLSGLPLEYKNTEAFKNLSSFADYFLVNNRDIFMPLDDSISKITFNSEMIIRRSRGYVPLPFYEENIGNIIALGSDMKNTFSISKGNYIYVSPHHGELINFEALSRYKHNIQHYIEIFQLSPKLVACDLHPNYETTLFSSDLNLPIIKVQHHHAHIASCMFDNNYKNTLIGIAFDGTGYGDDNCIWGSEFFICDLKNYKRVGHMKYTSFIGGEKSLRSGNRCALSYLYNSTSNLVIDIIEKYYTKDYESTFKILSSNNFSYNSSSMGRLFDAVSSLLGLCHHSTYEGEAAIYLESILTSDTLIDGYCFNIIYENDMYLLDPTEIINQILYDINTNIPNNIISLKFHSTIVNYILEMCNILRSLYNINTVALSGGVFQNNFILNNSYIELITNNFKVLIHKNIPPNDGGISLGQIIIAKNNN